jgi:hypothetical protein
MLAIMQLVQVLLIAVAHVIFMVVVPVVDIAVGADTFWDRIINGIK